MILTYINDHKLFIQFDQVVKNGLLTVDGDISFNKKKIISNSEFEIIELPENIKLIKISIKFGNKQMTRTISIV